MRKEYPIPRQHLTLFPFLSTKEEDLHLLVSTSRLPGDLSDEELRAVRDESRKILPEDSVGDCFASGKLFDLQKKRGKN